MTNEVSKIQRVLRMKSGIEIWIDSDKADKIITYLQQQKTGFGMVENRMINLVEIEGIFTPTDLEDLKRTKLGQRKCKYGNWHSKDEDCECGRNIQPNFEYKEQTPEQRAKAREALDKVREELKNKF